MVLRLMDIHIQKNEAGSLPYTIYKNELKMVSDLNIRAEMKY